MPEVHSAGQTEVAPRPESHPFHEGSELSRELRVAHLPASGRCPHCGYACNWADHEPLPDLATESVRHA